MLGKGKRGVGPIKFWKFQKISRWVDFQGNACIGGGVPQKVVIVRKVLFGGVTRQILCWEVGGWSLKILKFIKKNLWDYCNRYIRRTMICKPILVPRIQGTFILPLYKVVARSFV